MDKRITVQFFKIEPRNEAVPSFEDILNKAAELGNLPGERELELSDDGTKVRLERLVANGEWFEAEMVRVQRDNIPLEAQEEGLIISRAESLGHSAVLRYCPALALLVVEMNPTNMTLSRGMRYLRKVDDTARYDARPIPNREIWERYGRMKPKRFSVTLASITNPQELEGPVGAITQSSRRLHEMTNAPIVQISVRAGGHPEGLDKGVIESLVDGLLGSDDPGFEVTALSVSAEDEEEQATELLNFLDDILKEHEEINLNNLDSNQSFNVRMDILRACFAKHMDYIANHHGPA